MLASSWASSAHLGAILGHVGAKMADKSGKMAIKSAKMSRDRRLLPQRGGWRKGCGEGGTGGGLKLNFIDLRIRLTRS